MTRKNDMTQEENNPLIPKLRFPEFRNAGGWRTVQLSEVLDYERPDRYIVNDTDYVNDGIPVLTANKSFVIGYTRETENVYTDVPVVIFDDFTTDKKLVTFAFKVKSSAIKILKAKKGDDLRLLYELMAQIKFDAQEHKRYYISEYQYIKIPLPEINEQKKIAECLSTLDELIEAESRKLNALKDHKKGLMQQLFPREGETRPRLRFPEFRDTSPWRPSMLGKEASILKGKGISKSDIDPDGTQPCIRYGELYTVYGAIIGSVMSRTKLPAEKLLLSKANDVIIPSSGETKIDIATASCVLIDNVALGGDLIVIRTRLNGPFLSYYLNGPKRSDIARIAQGDTVVHLYPNQLEKLEIALPSRAEQQKIAECLSTLDDQIAAQSEKLEILRTHKRGLMQQLFPNPSEFES